MIKYKDWSPTSFDTEGLPPIDVDIYIMDYYVLPVMLTRDSEALSKSNFSTAEALLCDKFGDVSSTYFKLSFDHWGCGWFDILICNDEEFVSDIEKRLEDYPILDEDDFSKLEFDEAWDYFENSQARDIINGFTNEHCLDYPRLCDAVDMLSAEQLYDLILPDEICNGAWYFTAPSDSDIAEIAFKFRFFNKRRSLIESLDFYVQRMNEGHTKHNKVLLTELIEETANLLNTTFTEEKCRI